MSEDPDRQGTVIRVDKKICIVHSGGKNYRVIYTRRRIQGGLADHARCVAVGDEVFFEMGANRLGWLTEVLPRTTCLSRSSIGAEREQVVVANIDQMCIVSSLYAPPFRSGMIDRLLVGAHRGDLAPFIVINKIDQKDLEKKWEEAEEAIDVYEELGYEILLTSVLTGEGLGELKEKLQDKSTVFAGHSGVGKSALLTALDPKLELRIQDVGRKSLRGQHTTSRVALFPLSFGGFVADTPGIREYSLWKIKPEHLQKYFPDIEKHARSCKYKGCIHIPEPDCAVQRAVEAGEIALFRYENYCRILESIQQDAPWF